MGYLRRISNCQERIELFDLTHMMNMVGPLTISVKIPKIDNGYCLKKMFIELIHRNP